MSESPESIAEIARAIASRELSAVEVARRSLSRIEAANPGLNAITQVFADEALQRADHLDEVVRAREQVGLPLLGVPIVVKDNIALGWGRTTCGSRMLENYRSPFTATAVQRLIDAGANIIGKSNLDEFGMGSSTEHSIFGPTRNPWDRACVPGGSSGGSAAAVAAGMVPAALGSDTGGSIRQPAGWCNLVGLKPTYGRVSRYGLVAYASSLDQIGPLTRTVREAALMASVLCGHDPRDSTSIQTHASDFVDGLERPIDKLVLGVPRQAREHGNHPAVAASLENAIKVFTGMGAVVVDVDLPHLEYGVAAYYIIAPAEASSNLARFDGVRYGRRAEPGAGDRLLDLYSRSRAEGFGPEVQRRIMLGTHALSSGYHDAFYTTALKVRRLIKNDFDAVFEGRRSAGCHAVLMPASPNPAFRIGEKSDNPLAVYLEDVYTVPVNLAGLPGLTVPAGFAEGAAGARLPIGVQLIGPALGESTILRAARMFEAATDFAHAAPPA